MSTQTNFETTINRLSTYKTALEFKMNLSLDERRSQSSNITNKYPDRIPIICDAYHQADQWALHPRYLTPTKKTDSTPDLNTIKYLFPGSYNMGSILIVIRNRLKLAPEQGFTLFVGDQMAIPVYNKTIREYYDEFKDEDGFLYIKYACEATFG